MAVTNSTNSKKNAPKNDAKNADKANNVKKNDVKANNTKKSFGNDKKKNPKKTDDGDVDNDNVDDREYKVILNPEKKTGYEESHRRAISVIHRVLRERRIFEARPNMPGIVWTHEFVSTSRVGYWEHLPWSFEETVGRLMAVSGQHDDPGDKESFMFSGYFNGQYFTVYDYKGDRDLHIGAANFAFDVPALIRELTSVMSRVSPKPFTYHPNYGYEQDDND